MKKLISQLTLVALALALVPTANAASINGATAALAGGAAAFTIGDVITITSAGNFPAADEISAARINNLDGTVAGATTLTAVGADADDDASDLTIAGADLTDDTAYYITFVTVSGDFGVAQLNVGTPTQNVVVVTAVVEPALTLDLNNDATGASLGILTDSAINTATTVATISTNATSGWTLQAQSDNANATDGLYGAVSTEEIPATAYDGAWVAGTSAFGLYVSATNHVLGAGVITIDPGFDGNAAGALAIDVANQTIATSNGTAAGDTVTVTYAAAVSAVQAADNYATSVTYTATATF